ncbi:hypothetical protein Fcan01_21400 [Folsomia candida]|uniref:Uncharacterized protein n=1 Tax=Folsomia candida TaxID=158441 RepID=A0A226DF27_FOLCA|nr:hypothetical protein Fcan01_21400 [Folsomia candida]
MSFPGSTFYSIPRLHVPQQGRPNFLQLGPPPLRQPSVVVVGSPQSATCPSFTTKRPLNFGVKSCYAVSVDKLSPLSTAGATRVKRNTHHVSFSEMEDFELNVKGYREYRKHDLVNKFRKLDNQVLEEKDCWLVEKDGYFWGDDSPETIPDFNPAEEDEWMDDSEFQQHGRKPFLSNTILNEQEEGGQNSPPSEQDWLIAGMEVDSGVTPTEWPTPVSSAWASPTTPEGRNYVSGRRGRTPALTPLSGICADLSLLGFPEFPTPAQIRAAAEECWDD